MEDASRHRANASLLARSLRLALSPTVKAGQPKWTFVDYAPGAIAPPKRTGHTTVTHGDCIYVSVSFPSSSSLHY